MKKRFWITFLICYFLVSGLGRVLMPWRTDANLLVNVVFFGGISAVIALASIYVFPKKLSPKQKPPSA